MKTHVGLLVVLAAGWIPPANAAAPTVRFSRDVLPILADRCFHCHGPDAEHREADLRLDQRDMAVEARSGGTAVAPGDPEASELLRRVSTDDPNLLMPPPDSHRSRLDDREVSILRQWIAEGAVWERHWAFESPSRPEPRDATAHPIDGFVQRAIDQHGLRPAAEASRRTLIRRVTLDLIGLPPTLEEVDTFVANPSGRAYEDLVDRLLASPHYGERMAWPWLDAARYADTGGYQGDPERTMWPWRDWVVRALNDNMPFNQFTIEQLAGDLLPDATAEQRLATGFNRNHMHNSEGGRIAEETRVENVFDRVETTGTVWLGLTLQCARCHDHKFDPVSTQEYFALFDFFNQTSENGAGNRGIAVPPEIPYGPDKVRVMVMDSLPAPRDTFVLSKGLYNVVTDQKAIAGAPAALAPSLPRPTDRPLNRLDLARWIVALENPLTARVIVNRYWQLFFGRGLVDTPGDFGLQGARPTHPELLDWLALEFVESGWDVKHLHRLIVTSQTYRRSTHASPELLEADPRNLWLARAPRGRLPSWMLRDQALAAGGLLSRKLGGPPVKPYQPDGIWAEATFGKKRYEPDKGENLYRRSLYTYWRRIIGPTMFFDAAKRQTCEVKPNLTNTPLHALTTLNDVTYVEAARGLAAQVARAGGTPSDRVTAAFAALTARPPEAAELRLLTDRVTAYVARYRDQPEEATRLLSIGESPVDAELDRAELAAYTVLCNTLMNLDEVLVRP